MNECDGGGSTHAAARYHFDNVLVLPEYLVEFTYETLATSPLAPPPSAATVAAATAAVAAGTSALMALDLQMCSGAAAAGPVGGSGGGAAAQFSATHQAILNSLDADIRLGGRWERGLRSSIKRTADGQPEPS